MNNTPDTTLVAASLAQVAANRRNALRATGPRTPAGKDAAKLNALRHGALAKTLVIRGERFRESRRGFKKLCRQFYAGLAPVGPLEEMLVDKIVAATWRLQRALRAETGELTFTVQAGLPEPAANPWINLAYAMTLNTYTGKANESLERSVEGCRYKLICLGKLLFAVPEQGGLTDALLAEYQTALGPEGEREAAALETFRATLAENPENLSPEALQERNVQALIDHLGCQASKVKSSLYWAEQRENGAALEKQQSAAPMPTNPKLDLVIRYQAAIERQLYQAMHQLERLQLRRRGQTVPPPLAVDITTQA